MTTAQKVAELRSTLAKLLGPEVDGEDGAITQSVASAIVSKRAQVYAAIRKAD